jgi:probable DNA metabolism protein
MDHFAARLNIQPFIIHDARHTMAGVFDGQRWFLAETAAGELTFNAGLSLASDLAEEDEFQQLWQRFFQTVAIEERKNPKCQRNFMPKRFWGNMCEQQIRFEKRKVNA